MPATNTTSDRSVINLFERLEDEEYSNCRQCQEEAWGPNHFRYHWVHDGVLFVPGEECGGNGRRFDLEKKEFVGRSHCTCDECF